MNRDKSVMSMRVSANKAAQVSKEEEQVREWLAQVLDERINPDEPLQDVLHDGVFLCRLLNRVRPDSIPSINAPSSGMFLLRDNVETFLKKCVTELGLDRTVLFDVADLFEGRNMKRVYGTLRALSICSDAVERKIPPLKLTHARTPSNLSNDGDNASRQKLVLSADAITIIQSIRDRISSGDNPRGISTLHEAACVAEFVKAIDLIVNEEMEDANVRDRDGLTPLYYAVEKQVSICVERLLKYADPSIHYDLKYGQTVLHLAVTLPSAKIVDLLIHAPKTDINALTDKKNTPLLTALITKQTRHAQTLIDAGADVTIANTQGNTPLHIAIKINSVDCVRALLLHGSDTMVKNNAGESPLSLAHKDGVHPQIRYLVENPDRAKIGAERKRMLDADMNENENEEKEEENKEEAKSESSSSSSASSESGSEKGEENSIQKSIMDAVREKDAGTFRMLYEKHSKSLGSINFVYEGWTCLHVAATVGCAAIVKIILEIPGVDVNVKGKDGSTALVCATKNKHNDCVKLLMNDKNCDVNAQSEDGWNPVLVAGYKCDMESLDALCELAKSGKVDLEVPQKEAKGYHVLHFAAGSKDHAAEGIAKLLDAGAKIDAKNANGRTALHIAAFWDNAEAVRLLLDRGADKTIKDKSGYTAADLALRYDYVDLLDMFGVMDKRIKNPKKVKKPKTKALESN